MGQKAPPSGNRVNPIRPSPFSCSPGQGGGGGGGAAQWPGCHKSGLIEIKLCMRHYSHKSMPDAKFIPGSFSIFSDI